MTGISTKWLSPTDIKEQQVTYSIGIAANLHGSEL